MSDFARIDEPIMHEEPGALARHPRTILLLVFAAALLMRVIALAQLAGTPLWESRPVDLGYYHDWAVRILAGNAPSEVFEQSPLYAWFLAAIYGLFGTGPLAPRVVQIVLGALTCAMVCAIARRLLTPGAGLAAGLMAAAYGPFLFYDTMLMKESIGVFLFTLALWQLAASEGWKTGLLALAGLSLGLSALVRDNLILLTPVVLVWIACSALVGPARLHRRHRLDIATAMWSFAGGVLLIVLPVAARNYHVSGDWVLLTAGGGEVFYIGNNPSANGYYSPPPFVRPTSVVEHEDFRVEAARRMGRPLGEISRAESSSFWLRSGLRWIASHPGDWLGLIGRKLLIFWNHYELPDNQSYAHHRRLIAILRAPLVTFGLLAPLAAAGILLSVSWWRALLLPWIIGAGYLMAVMLFFNFGRFRMPMIPVLLVLASGAISGAASCIDRSARARRRPGRLAAGVGVFAIAWLLCGADLEDDPLHLGQSHEQLASLLLAAGRLDEAHAESLAAIGTLESAWVGLGGELGPEGHGLDLAGPAPRPGVSSSFLAIAREAYATHATILRRLGRGDEASLWDRHAQVPAAETLLMAALRRAQALHRAGQSRAALAVVEEALDAAGGKIPASENAAAHYGRALIHRDLGDEEWMRFHMRECLRLDPAHPRAAWMKEQLACSHPGSPKAMP